MPSFAQATVAEITSERPGLQRLFVTRDDGSREPAYVLTQVIGPVAVGDVVVVNTTAVELGLGTGGWHVVHWNLSRRSWSEPGPGHVMKLRYTSLQLDTGVAEEAAGYEEPAGLDGMPVVGCLLHSQVAAVSVAAKAVRPDLRVAYVMTDQASLPLALSDLLYELRTRGLVDVTITAGQAFGGDLEAVNVASALAVARAAAGADLTIVGQGPGVVGTATPSGFSGLELESILRDAGERGAAPVLALRWSGADPRPRHRGVSHQALTLVRRLPDAVHVAVPAPVAVEVGRPVTEVDVPDMAAAFSRHGLDVRSMGRSHDEDPGFFQYAGAAGVLAARLVPGGLT